MKIRECPFCGDKPEYSKEEYKPERFNHLLKCGNCGLEMFDLTKEGLIESWNTRYEPKHETVSEWEERTGEKYPETAPVYFREENKDEKGIWHYWKLTSYKGAIPWGSEEAVKRWLDYNKDNFVVANHHGKPEVEGD